MLTWPTRVCTVWSPTPTLLSSHSVLPLILSAPTNLALFLFPHHAMHSPAKDTGQLVKCFGEK